MSTHLLGFIGQAGSCQATTELLSGPEVPVGHLGREPEHTHREPVLVI